MAFLYCLSKRHYPLHYLACEIPAVNLCQIAGKDKLSLQTKLAPTTKQTLRKGDYLSEPNVIITRVLESEGVRQESESE